MLPLYYTTLNLFCPFPVCSPPFKSESLWEATHVGLAAGLFASLLKNGEEVAIAAGRAPAAARAIKVGTAEAT